MKPIIGIDIGGSKITGVVFNGQKSVKDLTVPTPKNLNEFKRELIGLLSALAQGQRLTALGVGIPGACNESGRINYAPNLRYLQGFPLAKFLRSRGFRPVNIGNDANCFALAEARLGQGRQLKNFIGITLGTGVGGGLISQGFLYTGIHGSAGEVGHMMADATHTYEAYFKRYRGQKNYTQLALLLGRMLADCFNLLDVEAIVLGGSVSLNSSKKFLPLATKEAKKYILNKTFKPKVLVSKLKNAGALGAALLQNEKT